MENFEQPQSVQPEVPTQAKSVLPAVIIAVVITAIIVGVGAYFLMKDGDTAEELDTTATPLATNETESTPTPEPTQDPMAGWETYNSYLYELSFRYPADWQFEEIPPNSIALRTGGRQITISKNNNPALLPPDQWVRENMDARQTGSELVNDVVNGQPAVRFTAYGMVDLDAVYVQIGTSIFGNYVSRHSQYDEIRDVFEQVLSTFTTVSPTSEWTNFSSKYFTLSFKVPSGVEISEEQNSISLAYGMPTSGMGYSNIFMTLIRYTGSITRENTIASFKATHADAVISTVKVDGLPFTRLEGTDRGNGTRMFAVFFEKSSAQAYIPSDELRYPMKDYISIGDQILSTFKFTK